MSSTAQAGTRGSRVGSDRQRPALRADRIVRGRIPGSSVESTRRVVRFDGRTTIVAGREPGGTWYRAPRRTRLTRELALALRDTGIAELVLKRGIHRASFSLAWLGAK